MLLDSRHITVCTHIHMINKNSIKSMSCLIKEFENWKIEIQFY